MTIEVREGVVLKDGEEVGLVVDKAFVANEDVHPKTVEAVKRRLIDTQQIEQEQEEPEPEKEKPKAKKKPEAPEQDPQQGDKTPAYVEWYRANHTEDEFNEKYKGRKGEVLGRPVAPQPEEK